MLGAGTGNSASADLAAIGDKFTKRCNVLVVDIGRLLTTERTWLLFELLHCSSGHFCLLWFWLQRFIASCSHCGAP